MPAEILRSGPVSGAKISGCSSLVAMMKPTDFWDLNNPAFFRRLDFPGFWGILIQSKVTAAIVIIREIGSKRRAKRFLVDHDDVIEAFPSDRANQAFDIRTLPR